ncbi:hypothetical protein ACHAW6_013340 [Cyclotella cf. meneghiniana]
MQQTKSLGRNNINTKKVTMRKIYALHLLVARVRESASFQSQPQRSATRNGYRCVTFFNPTRPPFIPLHSSFTDLNSNADEKDDRIKILLDSLDSLKTAPVEPASPEPTNNDPQLDDMVEKMAMPLKFLLKTDEKKGANGQVADSEAAGEKEESTSGDASKTNVVVESAASSSNNNDVESASPASKTSLESIDVAPAPASAEELSKEDVVVKKSFDLSGSLSEKSDGSPEKDQPSKSENPYPITKTNAEEEKPSDANGIFFKKSDDPITIDKATKTQDSSPLAKTAIDSKKSGDGYSAAGTKENGDTSSVSSAEPIIDSNFKALIQTMQPSSPLPSIFTPSQFNVDFGIVGGVVIVISLYLSLAAYLRGVDKDDGYAEWDKYKKREDGDKTSVDIISKEQNGNKVMKDTDVDTALNAAVGAIKDAAGDAKSDEDTKWYETPTPYGLVNKDKNPFVTKAPPSPKATAARGAVTAPPSEAATSDVPVQKSEGDKSLDDISSQLERISKLEQDASRIGSMVEQSVVSSAIIDVEKIEQFCEPKKVNPECSESISNYLGSLSERRVEEETQKIAASKIISYLDSLSSPSASKPGTTFSGTVPSKSRIVAKKEPSQTSAAFSSYLDALSSGSVPAPPSAQAVAGYLDVLSTEATDAASRTPTEVTSQTLGNRIIEVEDRLNRLESSVASLPDNIASRLIEWQMRQDQRLNDEIEKITKYLVNEKSASKANEEEQ